MRYVQRVADMSAVAPSWPARLSRVPEVTNVQSLIAHIMERDTHPHPEWLERGASSRLGGGQQQKDSGAWHGITCSMRSSRTLPSRTGVLYT